MRILKFRMLTLLFLSYTKISIKLLAIATFPEELHKDFFKIAMRYPRNLYTLSVIPIK